MAKEETIQAINHVQGEIMFALAQFKFLTPSQLKRLGVSKDVSYIRKQLASLSKHRRKPLTGVLKFGSDPTHGRLEYVHYLTKFGKRMLIEEMQMDEEKIKAPIGTSTMFRKDYHHRMTTIDFQVITSLWAKQNEFKLLFFDTYFDKIGNNRMGKDLRAKTKINLSHGSYFVPDAVFMLDQTPKGKELYLFELYNNKDTKYICEQIKKHAEAIGLGSPSEKYGLVEIQKAHRVIALFQHTGIKKAVIERLKKQKYYQMIVDYFLFKSLEELSLDNFFTDWENLKGDKINLF